MCFARFRVAAVAPDARPARTEKVTTTMNGRKGIRSFDPRHRFFPIARSTSERPVCVNRPRREQSLTGNESKRDVCTKRTNRTCDRLPAERTPSWNSAQVSPADCVLTPHRGCTGQCRSANFPESIDRRLSAAGGFQEFAGDMSSSAILVTRYIFAHFVQNRSQQGGQFGINHTKCPQSLDNDHVSACNGIDIRLSEPQGRSTLSFTPVELSAMV
ncbi:hypothetical protein ACVIHH_000270 [Bradyrhizobium sp. USDA 4518]